MSMARSSILGVTLFLCASSIANAGEALPCFARGEFGSCPGPVLEHVAFKSVVLQYVDPEGTELGESLARLLQREILESISDLPNAGVILAFDRAGEIESALGKQDINVFLQNQYHVAAMSIAEQQNAQMSIWGTVLPDGGGLYIQTFLTLRQPEDDQWMTLTLSLPRSQEKLTASLGRSSVNLPAVQGTNAELFGKRFYTRCARKTGCPEGIEFHSGPSQDTQVIGYLPAGQPIEAVELHGRWFRVVLPERFKPIASSEGDAWINLYYLDMLAQDVWYSGLKNVNLRSRPGGEVIGKADLNGHFQVLNAARHGKWRQPWYQIEVDGSKAWVSGSLINRRSYVFPEVHLIAGLYRYGLGQFDRAAREFEVFLKTLPGDDHVTRATTLKFLAISRLASGDLEGRRAISLLSTAAKLTPYDPSVYTLRALANIGNEKDLVGTTNDIRRALMLNRRDQGAIRLLEGLISAAAGANTVNNSYLKNVTFSRELENLNNEYVQRR